MTPSALTFHAASGALALSWPDGRHACLPGPRLRAACKCAECEQGRRHGTAPSGGTAMLVDLQPVGDYGLALAFSDGHARGIYPWAYLRTLAEACADLAEVGVADEQPAC